LAKSQRLSTEGGAAGWRRALVRDEQEAERVAVEELQAAVHARWRRAKLWIAPG
jgi:hypothetical protein